MNVITPEEIDHLAKLSRILLTEADKEILKQDLPKILEFVAELSKASKTTNDQAQSVKLSNLRADEPNKKGLTLDQLRELAPAWGDSQLIVPAVFGEPDAS